MKNDRRTITDTLRKAGVTIEVEYRNDRKFWTSHINRVSHELPGARVGQFRTCETAVWVPESAGVGYTTGFLFDADDNLITVGAWG